MPGVRYAPYIITVTEDEQGEQGNHCMLDSMNSTHKMEPFFFYFFLERQRYFKP